MGGMSSASQTSVTRPMGTPPLLELRGVSKSFPGCRANDGIDLAIGPGGIHALLGENGVGKSTLVKIVYGALRADAGEIRWRGEAVTIDGPAAAPAIWHRHGVSAFRSVRCDDRAGKHPSGDTQTPQRRVVAPARRRVVGGLSAR